MSNVYPKLIQWPVFSSQVFSQPFFSSAGLFPAIFPR